MRERVRAHERKSEQMSESELLVYAKLTDLSEGRVAGC